MIRLIVFVALAGLTSAQAPTTNVLTGCVAKYDAAYDYFPQKLDASNFTNLAITYSKSYKTITNKLSNQVIVLYQCGTPKPEIASANQIIAVPIQNATIGSTTVVTYLEILGQRNAIKYTTDGTAGYLTSPCAQSLVASGAIAEIDTKNLAKGIQQVQSTGAFFSYMNDIAANVSNAVAFPASADPGVKGRAEWLGFLGAFFNAEAQANLIGSAMATNFAQLAAAANAVSSTKPVVAWTYVMASYAGYPGGWFISSAQYQVDYTVAAGATIFKPTTKDYAAVTGEATQATQYRYNNSQAFLAALASVDIIIDSTYGAVNASDFANGYYIATATSPLKFVTNKQVYAFDKQIGSNGGTNWYEYGQAMIHVVLADLISATRPEVLPSSKYTPMLLRNIYTTSTSTVLTAKECVDANAALAVTPVSVSGSSSGGATNTATGSPTKTGDASSLIFSAFPIFSFVLMLLSI